MPRGKPFFRRPVAWFALCLGALAVFAFGIAVAAQRQAHDLPLPSADEVGPPPSPAQSRALVGPGVTPPLVATYFFYWYDFATQLHLRPQDGLPTHLPPSPPPSWTSEPWFERQFLDMSMARIDVALPVYWGQGKENPWSTGGLAPMVAARHRLLARHVDAPSIGLFYDTSSIRGVDLTKPAGIDRFYSDIHAFFSRIPRSDWALVDKRPVVWLFLPQDNAYDQRVFDETYSRFTRDFGVRPYIVRATGWKGVASDASYVWGVAQDGMQETRIVAAAGPGYDERQIPGRRGTHVSRADGVYYATNLNAAVRSGRPIVAIETWNEIHEASGIGPTVEYGDQYIDITRKIVDEARGSS